MSASEEERWAKKRRKLARYEEKIRALQEELAGTSPTPTPGKGMTQWCRKFPFLGFKALCALGFFPCDSRGSIPPDQRAQFRFFLVPHVVEDTRAREFL